MSFVFLKANAVDILFWTSISDELSGLQLLESITFAGHASFSAYSECPQRDSSLNVTDYLRSPSAFERFCKLWTLNNFKMSSETRGEQKTFIFVKRESLGKKVVLAICSTSKEWIIVKFTLGKTIQTLQTFSELEQAIPPNVA